MFEKPGEYSREAYETAAKQKERLDKLADESRENRVHTPAFPVAEGIARLLDEYYPQNPIPRARKAGKKLENLHEMAATEAFEINEKYKELRKKAEDALTELETFKREKLGMTEETPDEDTEEAN